MTPFQKELREILVDCGIGYEEIDIAISAILDLVRRELKELTELKPAWNSSVQIGFLKAIDRMEEKMK